MRSFSVSHLADDVLLRELTGLVARDRATTASMLAHLAEVESRKLYVPAGHASLRSYCVTVLGMSEDEAGRRIHVANKARKFPALLVAIAEGRLHLTGASLLASRLTAENLDELLAAATHKSRCEIEYLIACRFPQPDVPTSLRAVPSAIVPTPGREGRHVLEHVGSGHVLEHAGPPEAEPIPEMQVSVGHVPEHVGPPAPPRASLKPRSAEGTELRATLDREALELLRKAQDLEGLPSGPAGVVEALKRALRARVRELEKRKFGATNRPRPRENRTSKNPRHVPAGVRRAVVERDGGRCTFIGDTGHRCTSRSVEFDHAEPVARGGKATVSNIRLRCRAHNQYGAERAFGAEFMKAKRDSKGRSRRESASPSAATGETAATAPIAAAAATAATAEDHALAVAAAREARVKLAELWGPRTLG